MVAVPSLLNNLQCMNDREASFLAVPGHGSMTSPSLSFNNKKKEKTVIKGGFSWIFSFYVRYSTLCFICRPSDFTVSEDAGIEPRTVPTTAVAVRRSNHSARSHPQSRSHPLLVCPLFSQLITPLWTMDMQCNPHTCLSFSTILEYPVLCCLNCYHTLLIF